MSSRSTSQDRADLPVATRSVGACFVASGYLYAYVTDTETVGATMA